VHNFGTCKKNVAAGRRLSIQKRVWPQNLSEFANVRSHSVCKYEVVHRSRSDSPLHFGIRNTWQNLTQK